MSERNENLSGSLFPTRNGAQLQPRKAALKVKKSALHHTQLWSEDRHLITFNGWRTRWGTYYPVLNRGFHCPNEGAMADAVEKVNKRTGQKYKWSAQAGKRTAMGVRAGVLDWLNLARGRQLAENYSGLAIEFKVRESEMREDQVAEFNFLVAEGKSAHVVWAWPEAALLHLWYFGLGTYELVLGAGDPDIYLVPEYGGHDQRCPCGMPIVESMRAILKRRRS